MSKVRLAIIGNGMVGHRFIEDLLDKSDAANFDITVFCEEPRIAYDRVHLSSYFSHHTAEELSLVREGFYEKHGIKVLVGERAITYSAAIFLIPICISFDTAEKRRYATYLILNRRFSFEF